MPGEKKNPFEDVEYDVSDEVKSKIEDRLEDFLDAADKDDRVSDPPKRKKKEVKDDEEDQDDQDVVDDEDDQDGATDDDQDEDENEDGEGNDDQKDDDQDEIVLPDAHYRAAIHMGYEPKEIAEALDKNPEMALKFFEKMHATTNEITNQFAQIGRKKIELDQKAVKDLQDKDEDPYMSPVDIKKLESKYGEDKPEVVELAKMFDEHGRKQHEMIKELKKQQNTNVSNQGNDEQNQIWSDMNKFFSDPDVQQYYSDEYGKTDANSMSVNDWGMVLTGEQYNNRAKIIQEADAYIAGCEFQGIQCTYREALERAHLALNKNKQAKVERSKLKEKVKKRSKGITVKSSAKKKVMKKDTKESKEKKFLEKTKQRMKKTFGIEPNR